MISGTRFKSPGCALHSVNVLVCLQVDTYFLSVLIIMMSSPVESYVYDLSNGMASYLCNLRGDSGC